MKRPPHRMIALLWQPLRAKSMSASWWAIHLAYALSGVIALATEAWAQEGPVAAVSSADNRFEVFVESDRGIEHAWQDGFGAWIRHPAAYQPAPRMFGDVSDFDGGFNGFRRTIVAARDARGRVMVAWIVDGRVYYAAAPEPGASLNAPGALVYASEDVRSLDIATNADGRLELFTLSKSGRLRSFLQEAPGIWSWGQANSDFPSTPLAQISVTPHGDRLVIVGIVQGLGHLHRITQVAPGRWGGGFQTIVGGEGFVKVVARQSIDHRLEIFAKGSNGVLYHVYEYQPGAMSGFVAIGAGFRAEMQVVATREGQMAVISRRGVPQQAPVIQQVYQVAPNGGWIASGWNSIENLKERGSGGPIVAVASPAGSIGLFEYNTVGPRGLYFSTMTSAVPGTAPTWSVRQLVFQTP